MLSHIAIIMVRFTWIHKCADKHESNEGDPKRGNFDNIDPIDLKEAKGSWKSK